MKKIFSLVFILLLFLFGNLNAKTVTDLTGKKVTIKDDLNRIAIVPIPWASLTYVVDGDSSKIVGMHPSAKKAYEISMLKELAPNMKNVNSEFVDNNFNVNYEELALLKPDIVVVWDYQDDAIEKLNKLKIPVVAIKYGTLEDVQQGIKLLGDILNKKEKAERLINYHKDTNKYLASKTKKLENTKRKKILYLRDSQLTVASGKAVNNIMINMAGGENVAKDITTGAWSKVTMEQIIKWNPDIIILSNFDKILPEDIYNNKFEGQDWSKIDAVKNKKVFKAPIGIYRWDAPSAETPLMIKWIAKVAAVEVFNDYDIRKDIKDFYLEFFNYKLSDEELNFILNSKVNKGLNL
ncbi:ABC transporter substrate-binding protein [Fusobacterium necrophorum]|uniref:Iron(III) dicitrate-binding protein n=2 Tax=Fusobacterium necrophorum TaxID=859 RepID=A0AB73C227_9FUSO|nr:ABC transporter substrate-binding protein [Fusobacterium necrophorum]KDE60677.1 iron(III) dicitrate-binding protein [Fusobacterium necrophorum DJ-1]KDE71775.1 iron(III) dicitrate-binding protein [Fusobacterium necrophorum DJ-2]